MRKFFTILIGVCLLAGNAWADFYCAIFTELAAYNTSTLLAFVQNNGKYNCTSSNLDTYENDGYYDDPFPGSAGSDGTMYRLVCVLSGTCEYFRSDSFVARTSCNSDQVLLNMSDPTVDSWIQNGLAVKWGEDLQYDQANSTTNFSVCVDCEATGSYSYGSWQSSGTGRQRRTVSASMTALDGYYDVCPDGASTYEYQCIANYYGDKTQPTASSSLTCTACGKACGVFTTTCSAGSYLKSSCCAASGSTTTDTTGTLTLTAKTCLS